jgi:alginate O-acetyltransferase complex protein AlgI
MLFNSYEFIFLFLPATLVGFFYLGSQWGLRASVIWLTAASLVFYSYWNPLSVILILLSMVFNYTVGTILINRNYTNELTGKAILTLGIACNLTLLGYYKYANFFVDNLNRIGGLSFELGSITLPLAISFFTFQQIAYLVDAYKGETKEYSFLHYCLFVSFFPQLIAGPIVHHKEILPQFLTTAAHKLNHENLAVGLTIFVLGLFKKVVFADSIAIFATPVFSAADQGTSLTFLEAWGGALAYTMQIYFDFSGYSDMATGLARMFGIRLPLNFNSPYKATSIVDFWRRWHITLSRFLRDYLYIPLGGNRKGEARRYINLMITMLLGGLWHGAGWNFIIWGGLHGSYLMMNHAWTWLHRSSRKGANKSNGWINGIISRAVTFVAVVVAWVFFRAESFEGAINMLQAMVGANGVLLPRVLERVAGGLANRFAFISIGDKSLPVFGPSIGFGLIAILMGIALLLPNTMQIMRRYKPVLDEASLDASSGLWKKVKFEFNHLYSFIITFTILLCLLTMQTVQKSEFLYFDF